MIRSIKHRGVKRLYEHGDASLLRPDIRERIEVMLGQLDTAVTADALRIPNYRLHPLQGKLRGYWAVTVKTNWRLIFRLEDGSVYDVDLVDYH